MVRTKLKNRKVRRKIGIKTKPKVVRKDSVRNDSIPKAPTRLAGDNGANFRIKIRRK